MNARDLAFWFFGLGTAIAVNLISGPGQPAVEVLFIAITVAAAIVAVVILSREHPSSLLRHFAPHVLLTITLPLIILAAVGVWVDYAMVLAAALIAVATLTTPEGLVVAYSRLVGMTAIAGGALGIFVARWGVTDVVLIIQGFFGGTIGILTGAALMLRRKELFKEFEKFNSIRRRRVATNLLFLGVMTAMLAFPAVFGMFRTPGGIAVTLLLIGLAVPLIGANLGVLLTPERRRSIKKHWWELRRKRSTSQQYPPYSQLLILFIKRVRRLLGSLGTDDHATATVDARAQAQPRTGQSSRP